jgi:hypothetical protein
MRSLNTLGSSHGPHDLAGLASTSARVATTGASINLGPKGGQLDLLLSAGALTPPCASLANNYFEGYFPSGEITPNPRLIWSEHMFRTAPVTEPAPAVTDPAEDLIPLSVLRLDLPDAPVEGWPAYLAGRGIEVGVDDIGRSAISRADARQLFDERREAGGRAREVAERQEREAIEQDRQRRARLWAGIPADQLPVGVSAASAMFAADRAARPKRMTPLQEALSGESMTYHSFPTAPEDEE